MNPVDKMVSFGTIFSCHINLVWQAKGMGKTQNFYAWNIDLVCIPSQRPFTKVMGSLILPKQTGEYNMTCISEYSTCIDETFVSAFTCWGSTKCDNWT